MLHLTLAIGILVTFLVVKPLYLLLMSFAGLPGNLGLRGMYVLGDLSVLVGFGIAWAATRSAALERRIPKPIPGELALAIGVWGFLIVLVTTLASRFVPLDAYALAMLPTRYVSSDFYARAADLLVNGMLVYGVAKVLLALTPIPTSPGSTHG